MTLLDSPHSMKFRDFRIPNFRRPILLAAFVVTLTASLVPVSAGAGTQAGATARCARASRPFSIGSATVSTRRSGHTLPITVNYPAASSGSGARPVCGKFPLVIATHGAEGDGASAAALHTYLVRNGYVVAAPSFPSGLDINSHARDVSAVISKMLSVNRRGGERFAHHVKPTRVGVIGTSMGGMIGIALASRCCLDRRVDAVVAKAGMGSGPFSRRGPPVLMINGNDDDVITYSSARATYRRLKHPKGLITLNGIGHDLNVGSDPILSESSLGFFARYLRGSAAGLRRVVHAVADSSIATLQKNW